MRYLLLVVIVLACVGAGYWIRKSRGLAPHDNGADLAALYQVPRALPDRPLRVFHLGHSLVGRDMPAMLAQMAGHDHALQLGWGTALGEHWQGRQAINGFDAENATPHHRDARQALASGEYDAFVMTEMVRLKDALLYKDAVASAGKWADAAATGNPRIQVFLYESWHALDDSPEWLARFPGDLDRMWSQLLWSASRETAKTTGRPVWLIPAGQVMATVVAEAEAGGIAELTRREQLFNRNADGSLDPIHVNDLGVYLVALTHYAALYGKTPVGLPHALKRADGSAAVAPSPALARRMQEIAWDVVRAQPLTGL